MSNAGWYPDPSGQPGQFRYWDGSGWSAETATHPSGPPPGSALGAGAHEAPTIFPGGGNPPGGGTGSAPTHVAPGYGQQPQTPQPGYAQQPQQPQPGGYGGGYGGGYPQQQPAWGGAPTGGSGGGSGKTIGIVIGVVVLVIALGVGTFLLVRGLGDDDEKSDGGDDPTSSQTESGTETTSEPPSPTESTSADPTSPACAGGVPDQGGTGIVAGKLEGGGISVDQVAGYEPEFEVGGQSYTQDAAFKFADGMTTVSRLVTDGWVAGYGVGSLARERGYESPKQAAETAMSCLEQSSNYENVTRRDNLEEGDVDLGPTTGYSITSDILATAPGGIPGDRVVITVVDLGDDKPFGLYINYVPLGYNDLLRTQTAVGETLTVT